MVTKLPGFYLHTDDEIRKLVEDFRAQYCSNEFPVPINRVIELDMKIDVLPILDMLSKTGVVAFITYNNLGIWVDKERYWALSWEPTTRFILAHEVGHYVLHNSLLKQLKFRSFDDWVKFIKQYGTEIQLLEDRADEFAGQLLVERNTLAGKIHTNKKLINKIKADHPGISCDLLKEYMSMILSKYFGLTDKEIYCRIVKEQIFEELNLCQ